MRHVGVVAVVIGAVVAAGAARGDGAATFAAKCASCHAKTGKGNPAMAKTFKVTAADLDLTKAATQGKTDADLVKVVAEGRNKMPAFGTNKKLTPEEIQAVAAYMKTLAGGAKAPTGGSPVAPAPYAKNCTACHGKAGEGNAAMAKSFKVDPAQLVLTDATAAAAEAELTKEISEGKGKMPAYGKKLGAEDVKAIVAWIVSHKK